MPSGRSSRNAAGNEPLNRSPLDSRRSTTNQQIDIEALEAAFVDLAASYSQTKGIAYASWRDVGVAADVLKRAGVKRSSRST